MKKADQAKHFNRRHGVRPLQPLQPGEAVLVKLDKEKKWQTKATVERHAHTPRSYIVKTSEGQFRRNRRHLRRINSNLTNPSFELDLDFEDDHVVPNPEPQANVNINVPQLVLRQGDGLVVTRSGRVSRPTKRLIQEM